MVWMTISAVRVVSSGDASWRWWRCVGLHSPAQRSANHRWLHRLRGVVSRLAPRFGNRRHGPDEERFIEPSPATCARAFLLARPGNVTACLRASCTASVRGGSVGSGSAPRISQLRDAAEFFPTGPLDARPRTPSRCPWPGTPRRCGRRCRTKRASRDALKNASSLPQLGESRRAQIFYSSCTADKGEALRIGHRTRCAQPLRSSAGRRSFREAVAGGGATAEPPRSHRHPPELAATPRISAGRERPARHCNVDGAPVQ